MYNWRRFALPAILGVFICAGIAGPAQFLTGDLTRDGKVNIDDMLYFADQWMDMPGDSADLDGIAGVDLADFYLLSQNWSLNRPTIVINELMAKNDSFILDPQGDYDDWIEIYNYGTAPVDMAGMYLTDVLTDPTQWQIPQGYPEQTTIGPGGFLVLWADEDTGIGFPLHLDFKLSADGESIGLYDAEQNLIDAVTFDVMNGNESYGRYPDNGDTWQIFAEGTATPGASNVSEPPEEKIIITEIMYHPYHDAEAFEPEPIQEEYIELYNPGPDAVDLASWRLSNGVDFTFGDITVPADGYIAVAADTAVFIAKYPTVLNYTGDWLGKLKNRGEKIELIDDTGRVVDSVNYADEGEWAQRYLGPPDYNHRGWLWSDAHDGEGKSLSLISIEADNNLGQNWTASNNIGGTPGSANLVAQSDIAPFILDVEHSPVIPQTGDTVTVTAKIIDELDTGVTVSLHYRLDESVYSYYEYPTYDPADYTVTAMRDDGTGGDVQAGDNIYTAQIPPYADGDVIEFFISAGDQASNQRTLPAPSEVDGSLEQVTNLLYQVNDSYEPEQKWVPGSQPVYYLIMTQAELDRLKYIGSSSDRHSKAQMNGMFISIDGVDLKLRYNVDIRNRGEGTSGVPPNNYRINFRSDEPWKGVVSINLNSKYGYLQCLGSAVFKMADLPCALAQAVQVRVNGDNLALTDPYPDRMYGSYAYVEVYDSDFTSSQLPNDPDGNVYKAVIYPWDADLSYLGTDPADYVEAGYTKSTNESENDWTDLFELTYALDVTPDASYVQAVEEIANIDQWLKWFAAESIIGNNETNLGTGRGDDYYMYCGIEDRRFMLLPHDFDTVLGQGDSPFDYTDSIFRAADPVYLPVIERFLTHPAFVRRYYQHLYNLVQTTFSPDNIFPLFDQLLSDYVPQSKIDEIKQFVLDRNENVLEQIPRQFVINTDLPTSGGYYRTTSDGAAIYGTADVITTGAVRVNGYLADWNPFEGTWEIGEGTGGENFTIVDTGATWKYLDDGSDQGSTWYATGFNDNSWKEGPSKLGYGGDGEVTTVSYGTDSQNKYITTYFRHEFMVEDTSQLVALSIYLLRDDGAVVYLNGNELFRSNIDQTGSITYTTLAADTVSSTAENTFYEYPIDKNLLLEGINVLAVEVHQVEVTSSDLGFDLRLIGQTEGSGPITGIPLDRGLNRIFVETFGDSEGLGNVIDRGYIDIWCDMGPETVFSEGTLAADTTFDSASSPWQVTNDIIVPAGITLTIEPGTTVFFEPDTGITVNGRLLAEGNAQERIRLTHVPGSANWDGLNFQNTVEDNRLCYVDQDYGDAQGESIKADYSKILIDNMTWGGTSLTITEMTYPKVVISNSFIPSVSGEPIHGLYLYDDQYLTLDGNTFAVAGGTSDIVDWDTTDEDNVTRLRFLNNIFLGGGDDGLDLDGCDAYIEGNIFYNFNNTDPATTSNAISGGEANSGAPNTPDYTIVRNLFIDNDHDILLKEEAYAKVLNNTFIGTTDASIQFCENGRNVDGPAIGAYVDSSIFSSDARPFKYILYEDLVDVPWPADPVAEVNNSIITSQEYPGSSSVTGSNNIDADPVFVDDDGDFHLRAVSPATGRGANSADIGRYIPAGATISGEPYAITHRTTASLTIAGPAITHYKYRLMDNGNLGDFSEEFTVDTPLELTGLQSDHTYTVYVLGKNIAGDYPGDPNGNPSKTWTVDTSFSRLIINEVLAQNTGVYEHEQATPDIIELYYDGPVNINLENYSITDDPNQPDKYVFTAGMTMSGGSCLILYADDNMSASGIHLGFGLDDRGEGVWLYDNTGALVDSVEFGMQVPDLSIGRIAYDNWVLTSPTPGEDNISHVLGHPDYIRINELLADGDIYFKDDFIELYNPNPYPVDISGFYITDNPAGFWNKHRFGSLNFIPAFGFAVLDADDSDNSGHVDFRLSPNGEIVAIYDADGNEIDKILYGSQTSDVSFGRSPDGTDQFKFFNVPTPGEFNYQPVIVNEVLSHSHAEALDWVELFNTTNIPIDIGGWYLSDNENDLMKYRIPDGTVIDDNDFVVIYESSFGDPEASGCITPFALSENGETVYLQSASNGKLTAYNTKQSFGASETGIAFGRFYKSTGRFDFAPMSENTPALPNAYPKVGPIVISEFMYNPPEGGAYDHDEYEYIELYNITDSAVYLMEYDNDQSIFVPWAFTNGIDFTFSLSTSIAAHDYLILAKNPAAFNERYGSLPGVTVLGPYDGKLNNDGEKLQLSKPGDEVDGVRYYIEVEYIDYNDNLPWPESADGEGDSLHRTAPDTVGQNYGNDPANWQSAPHSPGNS